MGLRTVVHLRHAEREPGGVHLTRRGVRQAQGLARKLPRFDLAVTSPKPRAAETAEAMGCPVDRHVPELEGLPDELQRELDRRAPRSFAHYVAFVEEVAEAREHARHLAGVLQREADRVGEGGRLLVISHGEVVELTAVGALGAVTGDWGATVGLLEGVQLERALTGWVRGSVLRLRR